MKKLKPTIDYRRRQQVQLARSALWVRRIFLGMLSAVGIALLAILLFLSLNFVSAMWQSRQFEAKTNRAHVVGKTLRQVTALLGPPNAQASYLDGSSEFVYDGPGGEACRIDFKQGAATNVEYWSK
jgi:hypothetical protein